MKKWGGVRAAYLFTCFVGRRKLRTDSISGDNEEASSDSRVRKSSDAVDERHRSK